MQPHGYMKSIVVQITVVINTEYRDRLQAKEPDYKVYRFIAQNKGRSNKDLEIHFFNTSNSTTEDSTSKR